MKKNINIGIWGSSGLLGMELIKLFSKRPKIKIVYRKTSKEVIGIIENVEIAFLALKAEQSMEIVPELLKRGIKIIDLSGAFRINNPSIFSEYYKFNHIHSNLLNKSIYGLPEKNRKKIQNAKLIANPGCYATAINLGLLPLINKGLISPKTKILIRGISGYTGAGKGVKIPKTITPYKGGREHQHIPEIEQELNIHEQLLFFPQIAPWPRGIEIIIYVNILNMTDKFKSLQTIYKQFYKKELFVRIKSKKIKIDGVIGTNFCDISLNIVNSFVIIKVVIDNLGKGGAGQAVQNFNILCGFPEKLVY
ncbi:MAG: N-acetyl-gamma-glutamyl-phosphate reductase [bacterium]